MFSGHSDWPLVGTVTEPRYCTYCGAELRKMLSIRHSAELLDASPDFIRDHIARGTISTVALRSANGNGGRQPVRIHASELEKLIEMRPGMDESVNKALADRT